MMRTNKIGLRELLCVLSVTLGALLLTGCDAMGRGTAKAAYTMPKNVRILVMVDSRPNSQAPIDVPEALGNSLNQYLYRQKVADNFVAQARVVELRKRPDFAAMGVADLARAADADVVVYVDILAFVAESLSAGQLTDGYAQVLLKVVDKNGQRMYPPETEVLGQSIEAKVPPMLTDSQSLGKVKSDLLSLLTVRTGRLFHSYDLEDKVIAR